MAYKVFENDVLQKVFAVTLNGRHQDSSTNPGPPVIHLQDLENELRAEINASPNDQILLNKDNIERALMARLTDPPSTYPLWPVPYLLGCYTRAQNETRNITLLKDPNDQNNLQESLTLAQQLSISYIGLILHLGMFPQPPNAEKRGPLQLLDALYAACAPSLSVGSFSPSQEEESTIPLWVSKETHIVPLPHDFLDQYSTRFKEDGLENIIQPIVLFLMQQLSSISVLGEFATPLNALERLVSCKPLASQIVRLPQWIPEGDSNGRGIEFKTLLGTAFGISAVPDVYAMTFTGGRDARSPDVAEQCFPHPDESARQSDLRSAIAGIHASLSQLHSQLHSIVMALLRNAETREYMLQWLAGVLFFNQERTKMRFDMKKASTEGFMINYTAIMLMLCQPFLDPAQGKAWSRLDVRYLSVPGSRGSFSAEGTRLGMTSEEVAEWISSQPSSQSEINGSQDSSGLSFSSTPSLSPPFSFSSPSLSLDPAGDHQRPRYHFICEIFFMTAGALHLGVTKTLENCQNLMRSSQHYFEEAETMQQAPGMGSMQASLMKKLATKLKGTVICMDASLRKESFLVDLIGFYRLSATYLLRLASPSFAAQKNNNASTQSLLPLPEPAPKEFSSLPEYFVEDLCGVLSWLGRAQPELVASQRMEQFMIFFTVFLGSPAYVKNPYLRGKMVEALHSYMPTSDEEEDDGDHLRLGPSPRQRHHHRHRHGSASEEVATLFEVHPMVIEHMVRSLIGLYVDIERTDRHNAFYEKFGTRYQIGEVMSYLWKLPPHRAAWQRVAVDDSKLYIRFVNMMINDSQHLLQEALDTLPAVQETERLQENSAAWHALPEAQREEREQAIEQNRRSLQNDFQLAGIYLQTMQFTSEDNIVAHRFFDVQVRDRQARILNFFLRYLTLPAERRRLKLRDPEKYGWRPKQLITSLAEIHVNLFRADREQWAAAVAADTDYYGQHPDIFSHLVAILHSLGTVAADAISDVEKLGAAAATAAAGAVADEENFDEVPDEFEDPLSCRIMLDPVKLPSGTVLDRSTILQHLLTDNRDPFSRAMMSEDDLVDMPELKEKIREWVAGQRAKK